MILSLVLFSFRIRFKLIPAAFAIGARYILNFISFSRITIYSIDELVSDFNVDRKPANTILNPTIQAQSKSVGTAKDAHSNQSGKIATLPETGTADNLLLSVIGMGLSSLGLVISRREKHSK
ncbi:TPA: LPXTG cell wall anchor domain-containing protein [Streptococcus suis]|nr:LPXTG cell wall anchor domain-containing protein [Streptococcus suis]HEM5243095.1 LPXTG cell wall anchor domain-containing protein [Streptococcus suis]